METYFVREPSWEFRGKYMSFPLVFTLRQQIKDYIWQEEENHTK